MKASSPFAARLMPPLFVLIAVIGWALGLYAYSRAHDLEAHGERARGTVVGLDHHPGSTMYWPVIAFRTGSGARVEFEGRTGSSSPSFFKGETLDVLYPRGNPADARIDTVFQMWGACLIALALGSVFGLIGLALLVGPGKRLRFAGLDGGAWNAGPALAFRLVPPLFVVIAVVAWAFGLYAYGQAHDLEAHGEHARGTVIDFNHQPGTATYRPVIAFKTGHGFEVQIVGQGGSLSRAFSRGETVDVVYPRGNPVDARVDTFLGMWGLCLVTLLLGSIFGIVGLTLFFGPRLMRRRA